MSDPEWLAINAIRTLTIDAVQAASSGHPGAAMALATFGASAPASQLRPHFGFTGDAIAGAVRAALARTAPGTRVA